MRLTPVWQPPPTLVAVCAAPGCRRAARLDGWHIWVTILRRWCLGGGGDDWCPRHREHCKHNRAFNVISPGEIGRGQ